MSGDGGRCEIGESSEDLYLSKCQKNVTDVIQEGKCETVKGIFMCHVKSHCWLFGYLYIIIIKQRISVSSETEPESEIRMELLRLLLFNHSYISSHQLINHFFSIYPIHLTSRLPFHYMPFIHSFFEIDFHFKLMWW